MMGRYGHMNFLRQARPADHQAVDQALARVGMSDYRKRQIGELSGGQKKRVFLARALAQEGKIILLDEPFTGLDNAAAARLRSSLARRAAEGRAVVLVTHQLAEAWELASRVAVLSAGQWVLEEPRVGDYASFAARAETLVDA